MPQQQLAMSGMQQPLAMDPSAYMGALPQAANFGPQQQASMYYPQLDPAQMPYAQAYNPYAAQSPYMPQTMMQPQPQLQPQVFAQQYGQYQLPQVQPSLGPVPNAYLPAGVAPAAELPPALGTLVGQPPAVPQPAPATMPPAQAPGGEALGADGQPGQGLLHITMHDWEPDQPGQLWVTKGTLVNVSYRAAHGWVYAGTAQPGTEHAEPASEGWIPQAVVKRVSLCRVAMDWPAEGSGTLGVAKGEVIAVSKEAERGWVYGERIGPRQPDRPSDGWLPKKVLDYLQS